MSELDELVLALREKQEPPSSGQDYAGVRDQIREYERRLIEARRQNRELADRLRGVAVSVQQELIVQGPAGRLAGRFLLRNRLGRELVPTFRVDGGPEVTLRVARDVLAEGETALVRFEAQVQQPAESMVEVLGAGGELVLTVWLRFEPYEVA